MRQGRVLAHGATRDVLTASAIASLYDVVADVAVHERAGHLTVTPLRRGPR
jgi:ABC-type cobalamin/Fe3+-siderophores transport system ATPase subunit